VYYFSVCSRLKHLTFNIIRNTGPGLYECTNSVLFSCVFVFVYRLYPHDSAASVVHVLIRDI